MAERAVQRLGLRARLMRAMTLYALALVTLYTLYALLFAYSVEDTFLERELQRGAEALIAEHQRLGHWPTMLPRGVSLHDSPAQFPAEIRAVFEQEPKRREFFGSADRHYHLLRFPHAGQDWWLLAEVSDRLVFRQMRPKVMRLLVGSAVLALIGGLLLAFWLARGTTRRLSALSAAVDGLEPDALPRQLPALPGADDAELAILRRGLDGLLARVADSLEREQSFTRDASHELRTPLAVIVTSAEALGHPELPAELRSAALARLLTASSQLTQTLDALLELARVPPAGEAAGQPLLAAVEQAIVEQAARRPRPDLAVEVEIPADLRVALRPALLRILLANLIGNAFAHAAPGPLRIAIGEGRCTISNRAPGDAAAGEPGLGLGLSILRRLDERYGLGLRIEGIATEVVASFDLQP
ncbi:MAG: HAMP domain-containing histidine kinase [Xanthomonadales bacterium]|jgi:signal transduction histidine kinase|nr:HAMP domain-containing histidine kinase [Xanthomonadales bacterium]